MYTIPDDYKLELAEYRTKVEQYLNKQTDPLQFKILRVVHGIYEQRVPDSYMIRIRCAGGTISPDQLTETCKISQRYGSDYLHITTRQELQMHNVKLEHTPDILDQLYKTGLSTKGSGGNTVRNITASVESGVSINEAFDVTPYNISLTNFLISRDVFNLPRKLKIAFSNSRLDTALAVYNDLGFIASIKDGVKGFKVFLGGSPSNKAMTGHLLLDFVPTNKIFGIALAVIELFNKYGNRKNRHKARLRYVFYKYGKDAVFAFFNEIYNKYKETDYKVNIPDIISPEIMIKSEKTDEKQFAIWKKRYVTEQHHAEFYTAEIPVIHGNLPPEKIGRISEFAAIFGNDSIRFSRKQNIHIRHVPKQFIGNLYNLLKTLQIDIDKPYLLGNLVSCTGADTCQLGICFSKGGLQAIYNKLGNSPDWDKIRHLSINISGCPNSCGQHLIADLGFAGKVSRQEHIYPAYSVYCGARIGENNSELPELLGQIAAKDLPEFTYDLLTLYLNESEGKQFREFIQTKAAEVQSVFDKYKNIPSYEKDKKYYMDWGNNELFTLKTRGSGECSAGLLDLIESEIKVITKSKESFQGQQGIEEKTLLLNEMLLSASRLLCLSAKRQFNQDNAIYDEIIKYFIEGRHISADYKVLMDISLTGNFPALLRQQDLVMAYANDAIQYYQNLDDNLLFKVNIKESTVTELKQLMGEKADIILIDIRESWEKEIADIGGLLIPYNSIENSLEKLPKNKKIIIYCRTGRRSAEIIADLSDKYGYKNLYNLKGGIYAWADEIDNTIQKY